MFEPDLDGVEVSCSTVNREVGIIGVEVLDGFLKGLSQGRKQCGVCTWGAADDRVGTREGGILCMEPQTLHDLEGPDDEQTISFEKPGSIRKLLSKVAVGSKFHFEPLVIAQFGLERLNVRRVDPQRKK